MVEQLKIRPFKRYNQYTEEEIKQLPPLPGVYEEEYEKKICIWDGKRWDFSWFD